MGRKKLNHGNRIEIALNNHVTLRVRHDYPLDEKDVSKLNEVYNRSLLFIDVALAEVQKLQKKLLRGRGKIQISAEFIQHHQHMFDLLKGHFGINTDISVSSLSLYLWSIDSKLRAMREGLYAENTPLNLSHISRTVEKKYESFFGCTLGGYMRTENDKIYLNLMHLHFTHDYMTRVLIHECSHKFAGTKDFDGLYYTDLNYSGAIDGLKHFVNWCEGSYEKVEKLTTERRLMHADSIANFIVDVARHSPQTPGEEKAMQAYPDRDLIKTDVGRLFTAKKSKSKIEAVAKGLETVTKGLEVVLAAEVGYLAYKLLA